MVSSLVQFIFNSPATLRPPLSLLADPYRSGYSRPLKFHSYWHTGQTDSNHSQHQVRPSMLPVHLSSTRPTRDRLQSRTAGNTFPNILVTESRVIVLQDYKCIEFTYFSIVA